MQLSGAARHWVLASAPLEDWSGVGRGWCAWADAPESQRRCRDEWAALTPGPARWTLQLYDAQGGLLHEQPMALEGGHGQRLPGAGRPAMFPQFDLSASPDNHLSWANVLAWGHDGSALGLWLPWHPGAGTRMRQVELEWHRAPFPDAALSPVEVVRLRQPLHDGDAVRPLVLTLPARQGWRSTWLVARLYASDVLGHHYVHFVAPSNPQ
jgi:hypothetical protein